MLFTLTMNYIARLDISACCEVLSLTSLLFQKNPGLVGKLCFGKDFAYEAPDEPVMDALKRLETFFNVVVDLAFTSLDDQFETLGQVKSKFGVLQNFSTLDDEALKKQCEELENTIEDWRESRH